MKTLEFNGKRQSITEWSKELNLSIRVIYSRLRLKWSVEKTLTTPVRPEFSHNPSVKVTKSDAEIYLNNLAKSTMPAALRGLISKCRPGNKLGTYVRTYHRSIFDQWFDSEFTKTLSSNGQAEQHVQKIHSRAEDYLVPCDAVGMGMRN